MRIETILRSETGCFFFLLYETNLYTLYFTQHLLFDLTQFTSIHLLIYVLLIYIVTFYFEHSVVCLTAIYMSSLSLAKRKESL